MKTLTEKKERLIERIEKIKEKKRKDERNDKRKNRCMELSITLQVNSILGYAAIL